jgi:pimeloyl-ACP methyl ester carboxylesterase
VASFLLIPGGWHGGWAYDEVVGPLRGAGHEARAVTLSGLGEEPYDGPPPNLDTHIDDAIGALRAIGRPAILAAHSYGGMVLTGVADRAPELVARLVYLDAYVPADGDSCWSLANDRFRKAFIRGAGADGAWIRPSDPDPRARPHPLASLVQRIRLAGEPSPDLPRDYVYLSGWPGSPFTAVHERLRDDPSWRTHELPLRHNIALEAPAELVRLLLEISERPS